MSASSRAKKMEIDRLSALPDSLLSHILSFLEMKDAAVTSLLSKRWQFLWTESSRLAFHEGSRGTKEIRKFVARVHKTLVICSRTDLERFEVIFQYNKCFASDVNIWIEFAVKNKVKEVCLKLSTVTDLHTVPQIMFSNPSLTVLYLVGCTISPRRTIEWQSLTTLRIEKVQLSQHVIENILSVCPNLRDFIVKKCRGFNCLEVNSPSLCNLVANRNEPLLKISAPYLRCLIIWLCREERKLRLTNIPSLVRVNIEIKGHDWHSNSEKVMSNAKDLLEKTQHVKELKLKSHFLEVVSMLVVNGWHLPESTRRCLIVNDTCYKEHNISGIVGLLESSPNIETVIIQIHCSSGAKDSITWGQPARDDLNCNLLHLKTVKIEHFAKSNVGSDPILTLARILLKRAIVLEKRVIVTDLKDTSDFLKISQTLLTYPRSSQKATVVLHQQSCSSPSESPKRFPFNPATVFSVIYDYL